ncbi:hypothetical protein EV121DRAFT_290852 [Schizophyllum commune]
MREKTSPLVLDNHEPTALTQFLRPPLPLPSLANLMPASPFRLRDCCLPSLEGLSKTDSGFRLSALRRHRLDMNTSWQWNHL